MEANRDKVTGPRPVNPSKTEKPRTTSRLLHPKPLFPRQPSLLSRLLPRLPLPRLHSMPKTHAVCDKHNMLMSITHKIAKHTQCVVNITSSCLSHTTFRGTSALSPTSTNSAPVSILSHTVKHSRASLQATLRTKQPPRNLPSQANT